MNPNYRVHYEWTLDEGVNTPVEVVGDGGGTTKTQVTLEFQLQVITEIDQWLIVKKLSRQQRPSNLEKICETVEPKMSRSGTCTIELVS